MHNRVIYYKKKTMEPRTVIFFPRARRTSDLTRKRPSILSSERRSPPHYFFTGLRDGRRETRRARRPTDIIKPTKTQQKQSTKIITITLKLSTTAYIFFNILLQRTPSHPRFCRKSSGFSRNYRENHKTNASAKSKMFFFKKQTATLENRIEISGGQSC